MSGFEFRGRQLLRDAGRNKSTAFTQEERNALGLRGLLPHRVTSIDEQRERALQNLRNESTDIGRYMFLSGLQDRNERLFYSLIEENIEELMPIIYTPTVGEACRRFANLFRRARGFYVTPEDRGHVRAMLDNWPEESVKVVVVTDGQRILGLGDLGANGMGIPIGKLALYTACAGIDPRQCMPVMIDVGTNNVELREDPLYLGWPHPRVEGAAYESLVDEFVEAVNDRFPGVLVQFEDFQTPNAYRHLATHRERVLSFNDDIQGTAAVALAGVLASTRVTGVPYRDLRILFLGAGSAATGIGQLMVSAFEAEGLSREEATERLWFVDSKGLVTRSRTDLSSHKQPFALDHETVQFEAAIEAHQPHVLIGSTGSPGTFTESTLQAMARLHERPVVFALSNPTSRAECTADEAYRWSDGRAVFASGSPFDPVERGGVLHRPGQGNNAYIFPGVGLGVLAARARQIPDALFLAAAQALAECLGQRELGQGSLYPRLTEIRRVSEAIARSVASAAIKAGVADEGVDVEAAIEELRYSAGY